MSNRLGCMKTLPWEKEVYTHALEAELKPGMKRGKKIQQTGKIIIKKCAVHGLLLD